MKDNLNYFLILVTDTFRITMEELGKKVSSGWKQGSGALPSVALRRPKDQRARAVESRSRLGVETGNHSKGCK